MRGSGHPPQQLPDGADTSCGPHRVILLDLVDQSAQDERSAHFFDATPECFAHWASAPFAHADKQMLDRVAFTDGRRQAEDPHRNTECIDLVDNDAQTVDSVRILTSASDFHRVGSVYR